MSTDTTTNEARTMPVWALPVVKAKQAKLVKLAAKLGVEAPVLTVGPEYRGMVPAFFLRTDERSYEAKLVDVTTTGTTPTLPGGWRVLATVEHFDQANMVSCSPAGREQGLAQAMLHAAPTCDHCHLARDRRYTIVLAAQDGAQVRVGRSCLKDFLGFHGGSLDALWTLLREVEADDDRDAFAGARAEAGDPTIEVFAAAAAAIRAHGFVSAAVEFAYTTKARVSDHLFGNADRRKQAEVTVTEADRIEAEAIAAWLLASTDDTDYITNLRSLVQNGLVTYRYFGLAVSAPQAFHRHQGKVAEAQAREAKGPAGKAPVGKATVEGTVVGVAIKENYYGGRTTFRHVMTVLLDNGARVWGTCPSKLAAPVGARVRFTATFEAKHDDPTFAFYLRPTKASVITAAPQD